MTVDIERAHEALELIAHSAKSFGQRIADLWDKGLPPGDKPGWPSVDKLYTVAPGQVTVLTGWPGSGKSEWLDAVCLNLAKHSWRISFFSAENKPTEIHVVKLLEKLLGLPFGAGINARMTKDDAAEGIDQIETWFGFMDAALMAQKEIFSVEDILASAERWLKKHDYWHSETYKCGLVIDPWNELEHIRPQHWSETEYVSATLSCVRAWARKNAVHVWLVAHPKNMRRDDAGKLPVPRPDMISGSQNWWNKADNCVTVWREYDDTNAPVQIHVQKIRFKHIGKLGSAELRYDRVSGRYHEILQSVPQGREWNT